MPVHRHWSDWLGLEDLEGSHPSMRQPDFGLMADYAAVNGVSPMHFGAIAQAHVGEGQHQPFVDHLAEIERNRTYSEGRQMAEANLVLFNAHLPKPMASFLRQAMASAPLFPSDPGGIGGAPSGAGPTGVGGPDGTAGGTTSPGTTPGAPSTTSGAPSTTPGGVAAPVGQTSDDPGDDPGPDPGTTPTGGTSHGIDPAEGTFSGVGMPGFNEPGTISVPGWGEGIAGLAAHAGAVTPGMNTVAATVATEETGAAQHSVTPAAQAVSSQPGTSFSGTMSSTAGAVATGAAVAAAAADQAAANQAAADVANAMANAEADATGNAAGEGGVADTSTAADAATAADPGGTVGGEASDAGTTSGDASDAASGEGAPSGDAGTGSDASDAGASASDSSPSDSAGGESGSGDGSGDGGGDGGGGE